MDPRQLIFRHSCMPTRGIAEVQSIIAPVDGGAAHPDQLLQAGVYTVAQPDALVEGVQPVKQFRAMGPDPLRVWQIRRAS
jgi:hypothetical protein